MHGKNVSNYAQYKAEKLARKQDAAASHLDAVSGLDFKGFGKIARLNRDIVITEKIDGTNAAIGIVEFEYLDEATGDGMVGHRVYAQSRTRLLSPHDDNMGFAAWVEQHRETLIKTLGPGLYFGEWWGQGIQRGYGLTEKRFSLFDTEKWDEGEGALALANARLNGCPIYCVPLLYRGPWLRPEALADDGYADDVYAPSNCIRDLREKGSYAAPGYIEPEGVVIYHKASGTLLKATLEGDEKPKSSREIA
jgi:hypothetical protein